jgi:hypothetical protein
MIGLARRSGNVQGLRRTIIAGERSSSPAQGERRRALISLNDYADPLVNSGTRQLEMHSGFGLRYLLEWGRQAASPGPDVGERMTAIMRGLDEVGAAAEAERVDAWLREGPPEPPAPPVSMAYLRNERDALASEWPWSGD